MNPIVSLFQSRKFLLLLLDTVVSVVLYFFATAPNIEFLIGAIQPVFVAIIYSIALEDAASKANESFPAAEVAEAKDFVS